MPPEPIDPVFALFIGSLASASLATWFALAWRQWPLLSYEPRRPVPWNVVAPLMVLFIILVPILSYALGQEMRPVDEFADPLEMSSAILTAAAVQVVLYGISLTVAVVFSGATQRDCGLPEFADQFGRDLAIGGVTWLAALLPVYAIQSVLVSFVGEDSGHPLIKMVEKDPSWPLMFVAFIAAVVVAPIFEEVAFRLLLQGWLEKLEDQWIGWRFASPAIDAEGSQGTAAEDADEAVLPGGLASDAIETNDAAAGPPGRGLLGLPFGWAPIFVSSLLFSLAHLGQGPAPVALFALALMLGYVYQRTHRIIPCIVTHMLFNFTTLAVLALAAARGAGAE